VQNKDETFPQAASPEEAAVQKIFKSAAGEERPPESDILPDETGRKILQCTDPTRGEIFAEMQCLDPAEVDGVVETARMAWAMWHGMPLGERCKKLHRLGQLVRDQAWQIADLIAREQGKPVFEGMNLEVLPALDHLDYVIHQAEHVFYGEPVRPRHVLFAHKEAHYLYEPLGLVAVVTPYNLPFALPLIQIGAALAMGNAVLFKPSELTPLCGLKIGELCREAGLPEGLVNVLPMKKEDALYLITHPGIDKIFLTGAPETGREVMAMAGCVPKPVVLSLGSKNPAVVAGDADLDRAARGVVWGALANAGQHCYAIERVYVTENIASRFVELILEKVDALRIGDPRKASVDVGPLISAWRRRHVHGQVAEAVEKGARLLRGGTVPDGPGFFYPPTVVLRPPDDCRLMQEETLGPVISITVVDDVERAIMLANESRYSLSATGWTGSRRCAERLMEGLEAGIVTINDALYAFGEPAATKAGYRMSGHGHFHGIAGLREMCRRRFVSYDTGRGEAPLFSYPYDDTHGHMTNAILRLLHGGRISQRLAGLMRLLSMRRFRRRIPNRMYLLRSHKRRK